VLGVSGSLKIKEPARDERGNLQVHNRVELNKENRGTGVAPGTAHLENGLRKHWGPLMEKGIWHAPERPA